MKSIERNFKRIQKDNPLWGSYIVLAETVHGCNYSHDRISRWFNILVDKNEYLQSEKRGLVEYLYLLNDPLNHTKNKGILPLGALNTTKEVPDDQEHYY